MSRLDEIFEQFRNRIVAAERIGKTPLMTTQFAIDEAEKQILDWVREGIGEDENIVGEQGPEHIKRVIRNANKAEIRERLGL